MKHTPKHTPLPWTLLPDSDGLPDSEGWTLRSNGQDIMSRPFDCTNSDAAFIVKACNSHYKMLEACKAALEYMLDDSRSERRRQANMLELTRVIEEATNG